MEDMGRLMKWTVLDLGARPTDGAERWGNDERVGRIVRLQKPAPSGRRLGSRGLGLGIDALRVAARARLSLAQGPLIAMNPWTAVAARILGYRDVATVGLYAVEGSRSWRLLRRVLGSRPVVTLSEHEALTWRTAGGRSLSVRYGSTFADASVAHRQTPRVQDEGTVTIFVGGSSDRDEEAITKLASQVEASDDLRLIIAAGGNLRLDTGRVRRVPAVTAAEFSTLLASSDVVFLPLTDNGRAAGHMVLVEALQRGKPVVATWVAGMNEYFDGEYIRAAHEDPIPQLRTVARAFGSRAPEVQAYWKNEYSKEAFGTRVLSALEQLRGSAPL